MVRIGLGAEVKMGQEGYLRFACHSKPSMLDMLDDCDNENHVALRKSLHINSRVATVYPRNRGVPPLPRRRRTRSAL